jgi:hypothetical protein
MVVTTLTLILPSVAYYLGCLDHLRGRFDDAEEWFRRAESVHDAVDSPLLRPYNDVAWASMLADRRADGDVARARTLAERGLSAALEGGFAGLAAEATLVLTRC